MEYSRGFQFFLMKPEMIGTACKKLARKECGKYTNCIFIADRKGSTYYRFVILIFQSKVT
jgi:hypothetical protein